MNLYFSVDAPHRWVRIKDGEVESAGEVVALEDIPLTPAPNVITAVVPGEWVAIHHVSVPARSRAKMLAAVPYALEEFLSADVDELHFVPVYWKAGEDAIVAVVARNLVSGWIESCRAAGIVVDSIVPDYMLLPAHPATRFTVARVPGGRVLVRSDDGSGISFDEDFLDNWLDEMSGETVSMAVNDEDEVRRLIADDRDVDARFWDFGSGLDDWLSHKPDGQVNLLTGEFSQKSQTAKLSRYRIAIILVVCAVGIKLLGDAYLYFSLSAESGRLDRQMARTIMDTFPDVTSVIPSREQFIMQQEMDKLLGVQSASGNYLLFLSAVARATKGSNVTVEDLTYRDGKLTVSCTVRDFGAVDTLQQKFANDDRISVDLALVECQRGTSYRQVRYREGYLMNALMARWNEIGQRDRQILGLGGVLVLCILVYTFIWEPWHTGLDRLYVQLPAKRMAHKQIGLQAEIAANSAGRGEDAAVGDRKPLLTIVEDTARRAKLRDVIRQMTPGEEEGQVRIWLSGATFDNWLTWVDTLGRDHGVDVITATVQRSDDDKVDIRATLGY